MQTPFRFSQLIKTAGRLIVAALLIWVTAAPAAVQYAGVNLSGAEFGEGSLPGTYNSNYTYPNQAEVDYFKGKGMNIIRLPFRWERLQQTTNAALDSNELNRLNTFVSATTAKGMFVILDPHNYARYYGNLVGTAAVPFTALSNFWSRVSDIYRTNNHVIFGLMNEPNTMVTETWRDAANMAIVAIRATGATNLILVPGNAWTGAHSWAQNWYGTPNATVMLTITDSGNNFAFDVHQYLDSDSSGTSTNIVDATIGATRLAGFTQWLKDNNRKGFLGEFAAANATIGGGIGDEAISNMLTHVQSNSAVWLGWTWWAAGPWWGEYLFTLEPTGGSTDRPAMSALTNFFSTTVAAPAAPTANAATGVTNSAFIANWSSASGATGYRLDVANNTVFTSYVTGYSNLDMANVLTKSVTNLTASTTYYYRLRAYNAGGISANSGTNTATTSPSPPGVPPTIGYALSGGNLLLYWPTTYLGYTLESATHLPAASWVSNSAAPAILGGNFIVTNPVSGPEMFFRLTK